MVYFEDGFFVVLLWMVCFEKGFLLGIVLGAQVSCSLLQVMCFEKGFFLGAQAALIAEKIHVL